MIEAGDPTPELRGVTVAGVVVDLASFRPRPVVVEFFRGTWCPNCRKRLAALREILPRLEREGAGVLGVVCQKRANAASFFRQDPLPFPLVVDEDRSIARRFGVYRRLGLDAVHIARPATFVIDGSGVVRLASVAPSQFTRIPLEEVLDLVARLAA